MRQVDRVVRLQQDRAVKLRARVDSENKAMQSPTESVPSLVCLHSLQSYHVLRLKRVQADLSIAVSSLQWGQGRGVTVVSASAGSLTD